MPYIKQDRRLEFETFLKDWESIIRLNKDTICAGDLNYIISCMIRIYAEHPNYAKINDVVGLLECIKQEYLRKVVGPYEDLKEKLNGSI